jgi:hypothetical protein
MENDAWMASLHQRVLLQLLVALAEPLWSCYHQLLQSLLLYSSLLLQVSGSQGTLNLWETNRGTDTTEMTLLVRVKSWQQRCLRMPAHVGLQL